MGSGTLLLLGRVRAGAVSVFQTTRRAGGLTKSTLLLTSGGRWGMSHDLDPKANEDLAAEPLRPALAVPGRCPVLPMSVFPGVVHRCAYLWVSGPSACGSGARLPLFESDSCQSSAR